MFDVQLISLIGIMIALGLLIIFANKGLQFTFGYACFRSTDRSYKPNRYY